MRENRRPSVHNVGKLKDIYSGLENGDVYTQELKERRNKFGGRKMV
jgi:hypothetical protein